MSAKGNKKTGEGSRKKLREENEAEELKKAKKSKSDKHVQFSAVTEEEVEEIGGKSKMNSKNSPKVEETAAVETEEHANKDFTVDWPQEDLQQLFSRMEACIPEKDSLAFSTRVEKLNWEKIAFNHYTPEECKKTWSLVQKRIRRFRILSEILRDAKEWISKPWTNFYKAGKTKNHPEKPRRPLSTYMLFYLQKKDEILSENPGMEMTDVSKKLSELYKALSAEERAKYAKMALEKRKEYEEKLQEFYLNHPEFLQHQDKPKAQQQQSPKGPKKPPTPFMLFYKEQLKKCSNVDEAEVKERSKMLWKNMSDKKKVVWINWASEKEVKYKEELKDYISQHPDFSVTPLKPVLTKKEKLIQERMAGKPVKPPNSAYSLFSRIMLQSEDIKNVDVKDRLNFISKQWKMCSEEEKQEYKERADHLMEQYKLDFASYLESLPEDRRAEELKKNIPKRKAKDINQNQKSNSKNNSTGSSSSSSSNKRESQKSQPDDLLFKGEPKQPPLTAIALFKSTYSGKKPVKQAWKALNEQERKKYAMNVKKMKTKYIAEFEVFLKSLTKEEIKAYKKHRKQVEERTAALEEKDSSCESSEFDSDSSEC